MKLGDLLVCWVLARKSFFHHLVRQGTLLATLFFAPSFSWLDLGNDLHCGWHRSANRCGAGGTLSLSSVRYVHGALGAPVRTTTPPRHVGVAEWGIANHGFQFSEAVSDVGFVLALSKPYF